LLIFPSVAALGYIKWTVGGKSNGAVGWNYEFSVFLSGVPRESQEVCAARFNKPEGGKKALVVAWWTGCY